MRLSLASTLLALVLGASASPRPQVSAGDIVGGGAGTKYSGSSGVVDPNLLAQLFGSGTPTNVNNQAPVNPTSGATGYTPPKEIKPDTTAPVCTAYAEQGYQCVPYYQCDGNGEIITDGGEGLIDIRLGPVGVQVQLDPSKSKCKGDLEVCCRHPDWQGTPNAPPVPPPPPPPPKPIPYASYCGTRNVNGIGVRIQNNPVQASTQFGEWPHMCAILENKNSMSLYVCGASLIAPNVVLTAAHCVDKLQNSKLKVRCGEWDTQRTVEPVPHQDRDVKFVSVHPGFSPRNLKNDVALLHTVEPFILSAHIDVMCLPNINDLDKSFQWEHCVATGWGKDKFGPGAEYQTILKQVSLNLVPFDACQKAMKGTRLGANFELDPSFTCAGGQQGVDTCKGDGGGPLVCPTGQKNKYGDRYVQAGIVSWGIGCGEAGVPGVYASVSKSLCFIDWATRCVEGGITDRYGVTGCTKWAQRERLALREEKADLDGKLAHSTDPKDQARINKSLAQVVESLNRYDAALKTCQERGGNKEAFVDDDVKGYNEDVDLSSLQRTGAGVLANVEGVKVRLDDSGNPLPEEAPAEEAKTE